MILNGFVNINKPQNMTSSDAVVKVRGILRKFAGEKQKVGHLGTLDPMATGVLPIAVGKAARLFDLMQEKQKKYIAVFRFGIETDTLDIWGKQVSNSTKIPTKEEIENILPSFIGDIEQVPPAYSSKSINGTRAYVLARKGREVDLPSKKITIYDIKLVDGKDTDFTFEITCGSGTYIRALARDIASKLDTVATMIALNRVQSGNFDIEHSVSIDDFEQNPFEYLLQVDKGLDLPSFTLDDSIADKVLNGIKLEIADMPTSPFYVYHNGEVVGIGVNLNGHISIKVRLK